MLAGAWGWVGQGSSSDAFPSASCIDLAGGKGVEFGSSGAIIMIDAFKGEGFASRGHGTVPAHPGMAA
ncbi:hypothetical protein GIY56_15905 [Paracoccus sp. YIM 132242]|uniref:Uncharacterized protein n=1 Tax=Paracoccus lichenicola TaxID=2665644 RepID=A0A6L6HRI9_9RHOB|nr:hypothetical protein [Paracoccus lichenicola]MTE01774.1 hypothetical protein [Paracoccus lichenicola]